MTQFYAETTRISIMLARQQLRYPDGLPFDLFHPEYHFAQMLCNFLKVLSVPWHSHSTMQRKISETIVLTDYRNIFNSRLFKLNSMSLTKLADNVITQEGIRRLGTR